MSEPLLKVSELAAWYGETRALERIDLEVRADNGAAIRLYERLGFVLEGRRAKGLCHRGVFFETVEMGLIL